MKTLQPVLRNGRNVRDPINMPTLEFEQRILTLREWMRAKWVDLFLAYGHAFNDYGHPCYLTNYVIRLPRGTLVAVTRDEVTLFFEGASRGLPSAKKTTWVEEVRACSDVSQECAKYMKEKSLIPSTVALAGLKQWMPHHQLKALMEALEGCTIEEGDQMIGEMRMVKSFRECDQVRRAARIVKHVFDLVKERSFPKVSERVIEAAVYREARLEGAEDVRVLVARPGDPAWGLRQADEASVGSDETLILCVALAYERYWAEGIRTFAVKEEKLVDPGLEGLEALYGRVAAAFKPGKALSRCVKDALVEVEKSKMVYAGQFGLAQGIGLSVEEGPLFEEEGKGDLEEGICFTLRLCVKDEAMSDAMLGNTFCVSHGQVESLTS